MVKTSGLCYIFYLLFTVQLKTSDTNTSNDLDYLYILIFGVLGHPLLFILDTVQLTVSDVKPRQRSIDIF